MLLFITNIIFAFLFFFILFIYLISLLSLIKKDKDYGFTPKISIIIPAYNEEDKIYSCLRSVYESVYPKEKLEVIVVDDGSIDNTYKIAVKFKGIKVIKTKHSGKSNSINKALSVSKGEIIAIVDGDSYIDKDALKIMAKEVERKNVVAATGIVKVRNRKNLSACGYI